MNQSYQAQNDASRKRLVDLVARLDDEALRRPIADGWTVGAVLAHLAFWDESCVWRWEEYDRTASFPSLSGEAVELINMASLPAWRALHPDAVKTLVVRAAEDADARTGHLSSSALAYVRETDRPFILERFAHRNEHVEQIERFLGH